MIKKSVFEEEIILNMQRELNNSSEKIENINSLDKAVNYLQASVEILDELGLYKSSDAILNVLTKMAKKAVDRHTKGLTPEKMVKNLLHHGTQFNMASDSKDLEVEEELDDSDFEDET